MYNCYWWNCVCSGIYCSAESLFFVQQEKKPIICFWFKWSMKASKRDKSIMLMPKSCCLQDINIVLISWRNELSSKSNSRRRRRQHIIGAVSLLFFFDSLCRKTVTFHCNSTGIFHKCFPRWKEGKTSILHNCSYLPWSITSSDYINLLAVTDNAVTAI